MKNRKQKTVTKNRWKNEEVEILRKMVDEEFSDQQIAEKLNKTAIAVYHKREGLNIKSKSTLMTRFERYSIEENKLIQDLMKEGLSTKEIAERLNKSYNSIRAKIYNFKAEKVCVWKEDELNSLSELFLSGVSQSEIATRFNKKIGEVKYIIGKLKLSNKGKIRWTQEEIDKIIFLLNQNISLKEISITLNRGICSIIKEIGKLGVNYKYNQIKIYTSDPNYSEIEFREKIFTRRLAKVKSHSKKRNIEFRLTINDMIDQWETQRGLCAYTKLPMNIEIGAENGVSIDRIDSDKDYSKDNIVLCIDDINKMKRDIQLNKFYYYCQLILKNQNVQG